MNQQQQIMKKVILFGATGNLGKEIAKELINQGYDLTLVVRDAKKAQILSSLTSKCIVADVCNHNSLANICDNQEIVVSALGKSVSLNDKSKPTFRKVDYAANENILKEALQAGVKKFVYISAFHAEKYLHLEYFKVHHDFSERLQKSGINFSIIKPPAIFSAFLDLMKMAKNGQLMNIGRGDKKTNPIYEGDLAKVVVESIKQSNTTVEAGGEVIYSRRQINEIIQQEVNPNQKIRTVPIVLLKFCLPLIKFFDKNSFDKFSFFIEVMQHDTITPQVGTMKLEDYVRGK